ncbi:N(4)-(Beta-N-acetylglucosaminyl)-L-asparaginase-like [Mercenaria mercenaria]|uniref:N(4)-(Beta-N-acetylglucosaminyl)-L-asparaginase- like n=1 Tax=Mercenaria mercenaria TaxID=6596 RepID=UPI00234E8416|nr:N(4)-(Beta-N-acetylglucosaminyl)-L-asparaginase-like [Mercenaria mercenaria]
MFERTLTVGLCVLCFVQGFILEGTTNDTLPLVLTTWPYQDAVRAGWMTLTGSGNSAVDAVEATGHSCEMSACRHTVGFGGSPDESGETTLDAMIMDGTTHNVGAVGGLRRIKQAISVARKVLDNTDHTLLVGDAATQFAVEMGFMEENLTTSYSEQLWEVWKNGSCQPNFRENVFPDPSKSCGPYHPIKSSDTSRDETPGMIGENNHDTIGIIAIDAHGTVASGASTNGLTYKIPGRVGDTPVAGAGSYADTDIGAAACTGNGDIMMRFLPSYHAVTLMGTGMSPTDAAMAAINAIRRKYPTFSGAVVAANKQGEYGAACHVWTNLCHHCKDPSSF